MLPGFSTRPGRLNGFTLMEMLVVIVIVSLVAAVAFTGWSGLIARLQSHGVASQVRDALVSARMDAQTRNRNTGVLLDPAGFRFLVFVDSSAAGPNGRYDASDVVLHSWSSFSSKATFVSLNSSISPDPIPRTCNAAAAAPSSVTQSGTYSVVFRPDGRSWAAFQAKLVPPKSTDTFVLGVLPSTGLVTLEQSP